MFARLTSMRGIGKWTAEYMMLRGYGRMNIFPIDDSGARARLIKFLGLSDDLERAELEKLVHLWKPPHGFFANAQNFVQAHEGARWSAKS